MVGTFFIALGIAAHLSWEGRGRGRIFTTVICFLTFQIREIRCFTFPIDRSDVSDGLVMFYQQ
jgi:hypothetical protein